MRRAHHSDNDLFKTLVRGVNTNDERIAALERRVKELETCCEKLRAYVDDLDKRKADRTADRPPVYFQPGEVPRFEGSQDELTRQQRR
ncbi:MAG TPA: hypothetical protein VEG65_05520 [Candidatus Bathyarchaeia archaeon]|nr:hypothetical protein [Candidatus Bathyarchaeia archaeon]